MSDSVAQKFLGWARIAPGEWPVMALIFGLLGLGAFLYIWPNVRMVQLAYQFQQEQKTHQSLLQENTLLRLEHDSLQSLSRTRALASSQLGMQAPSSGQVVTVFIK